MSKMSIGVLGATGMVGQMIVHLLEGHPWFEMTEVAASERTAGKNYGEAMQSRWNVGHAVPESVKDLTIRECRPDLDCDLVLSALDSGVALGIEEDFAKAGYPVSSNAKNHRMEDDVPLLVAEVNSGHVSLIDRQKKKRGWKGFIATNPNCSTIQMCLALKPLQDRFGLEKVMVTTMQALSGAGYPGVSSLDALDNVIPYIGSEEEKLETEPLKILGSLSNGTVKPAKTVISAQCNRVAVRHGHTESVSVKLTKSAGAEEMIRAFRDFNPLKDMGLSSAPKRPVIYLEQENRPQPKLDAMVEDGMASVVGRLRKCNILDYKFTVLGHNLIRGAAGGTILNAELLKAKGYLESC